MTDTPMQGRTRVTVRVYGPLNDFLPVHRQGVGFYLLVDGHPGVKDVIEGIGVPHPEIDLILVNGESVPFDHATQPGDRIAVFPRFMTLGVAGVSRVRPEPPDEVRFVADVHLGALARRLRLLGLDTAYAVDARDEELADLAYREQRILLTRDQDLLKRRIVAHGYLVRGTIPHRQLVEVLRRFDPLPMAPFSRCLRCNTRLRDVPKDAIDASLLPRTRRYYDRFRLCDGCGRVYWQGSHWERLSHAIEAALQEARSNPAS